jgi:alkanesulfonate monooxygenase SsuD/methylene tetrahydromethanopterin reductase-like flavin-dependent oxidoreductase (luciferase family)
MKLGLFLMPAHPPERSLKAGAEFDLRSIVAADRLGYEEVWIGEHFTAPWEPCPAPDLLIAQALMQTERIRLGAGAHLLPYHHPAELAARVAYLDHLSGGRLMFGVGAGGVLTDFQLFGVDGIAGENRTMMWEALDMILRLWETFEPFEIKGEHWTVAQPAPAVHDLYQPHLRPLQQPHPPIAIAALSPNSGSLRVCGERGFSPMSLNLNSQYIQGHWAQVEAGAVAAGRVADRANWRVVRDVFVAETDEIAVDKALNGGMGRMLDEYFIPQIANFGFLDLLKHDPSVADSQIDAEYLVHTNALVGSVDTVIAKLRKLQEEMGGFGTLLQLGYDYVDDPDPWYESMELLARDVMPALR